MTFHRTLAAALIASTMLTSVAHAHETERRTELFRPGVAHAETTMPDADAAAAMALAGYGDFGFESGTDVAEAREAFARGIALLWGFNHSAAASAFLAATLVPFASEITLAGMAMAGWGGKLTLWATATAGNTLGSLLIDAYRPGAYGGTGHTGDWALAAGVARSHPILLAGGLTPANVATAVAQVQPWGVDVASGVESAPGIKDAGKMQQFITAARSEIRNRKSENSRGTHDA